MRYITIKRYRRDGIGGHFNLPYGTAVEKREGMPYYNNRPICVARSFSSHEHFAIDDDGQGQENDLAQEGKQQNCKAVIPDELVAEVHQIPQRGADEGVDERHG